MERVYLSRQPLSCLYMERVYLSRGVFCEDCLMKCAPVPSQGQYMCVTAVQTHLIYDSCMS